MDLRTYLERKYSPATVKVYHFEIEHYLAWMGVEVAPTATYSQVLQYLDYLRSRYDNPATLTRILATIKQYYQYLIDTGQREDHPCASIRIRDRGRQEVQLQDLLSKAELELLLTRKERYELLTLRNQVIMSLLVYQALLSGEICRLTLQDVDTKAGTIYIQAGGKTNERTLPLKAEQILLLHRYITEVRPQLITAETNALVITKRGTAELGEGIHYLVTTFRKLIPNKHLTTVTIRQSVIALMLKAGTDLRIVQTFAGHTKPSTTERYRVDHLEELREAVAKYHPLR
mgnify:CR=1 FL=1